MSQNISITSDGSGAVTNDAGDQRPSSAREILEVDAIAAFGRLGLNEHLTPQRSNGVRSMVERIRRDARAALEGTSSG